MKDSTTGKIEAAAGIGLALGAAALGAFIATRKSGEGKVDAPWFTRRGEDVVGRTVTIRKPRAELYAFWREFTNLASEQQKMAIRTALKDIVPAISDAARGAA